MFIMLALAALLLAACQPAVETAIPATEPAAATTQPAPVATQMPAATLPAPADTQAPAAAPTESMATAEPSGPGAQIPEGWEVFTDTANGYAVAYPPVWEMCEEHAQSRIFCEIQAIPEGMGPPLRMYISVIPQDSNNGDFEIYNFLSFERIREFMVLPVGESMLREPGAMAPDYFTYTRLPNRTVAGWSAAVIENSKVWEFPEGTRDRVVFIVTEGTTNMIGMYYQTPEQLEMFEQALDSFQFVP